MATYRIRPSAILQCAICELQSAKYRCPRCDQRTCSLPCSKKHKAATGCSGIRDRVAFVAVRDFSDQILLNDFSFLEEVSRIRDRSTRDQRMIRPKVQTNRLVQACNSRHVNLRVMASGMTRRRKNRSLFDQTNSRILWTVEFVFGEEHILRHRIDENMTISDVLKKIADSNLAFRHRLNRQSFAILLAPSSPSAPFRRIPPGVTLKDALTSSTIIEFPVLHIAPDSELTRYEIVEFPTTAQNREITEFSETSQNRYEVELGFQTTFVPIQAL